MKIFTGRTIHAIVYLKSRIDLLTKILIYNQPDERQV